MCVYMYNIIYIYTRTTVALAAFVDRFRSCAAAAAVVIVVIR